MAIIREATSTKARVGLLTILAGTVLGALSLAGCAEAAPVNRELYETTGPLERFLNEIELAEAPSKSEIDHEKWAAENSIALCMKEQGFVYTPDVAEETAGSMDSEIPAYGSEEFMREYGFGIAIQPQNTVVIESEASRLNSQYLDTLSDKEYEAYRDALHGSSFGGEGDSSIQNSSSPGCYEKAYAAVFQDGENAISRDPELVSFLEAASSFYDSLEQPPQVDELIRSWNICMEENGYGDYATSAPETVQDPLDAEYDTLIEAKGIDPSDQSNSRLKQFIEKEFAVAKSDFECRSKFDFNRQRNLAFNELEQRFVESHEEEIGRLRSKFLK